MSRRMRRRGASPGPLAGSNGRRRAFHRPRQPVRRGRRHPAGRRRPPARAQRHRRGHDAGHAAAVRAGRPPARWWRPSRSSRLPCPRRWWRAAERLAGRAALDHASRRSGRARGADPDAAAGTKPSVLEKRARVVDATGWIALGSRLGRRPSRCAHDTAAVSGAIVGHARRGRDPMLVFGASAIVDRGDVIPAALSGGRRRGRSTSACRSIPATC